MDDLIFQYRKIAAGNKEGSFKTQHNRLDEINRIADTLRECGMGVCRWENITRRHIQTIVDKWKQGDIASATIKNRMSTLRWTLRKVGNLVYRVTNAEFGIANRVYVKNINKAAREESYQKAVDKLSQGNIDQKRMACAIQFMRLFGLRREEAIKVHPTQINIQDNAGVTRIFINYGTKGGRDRWVPITTNKQRELLKSAVGLRSQTGSLISGGYTERKWEPKLYREAQRVGFGQGNAGSFHGLRHAYAQERLEQIAGFKPRVCFKTAEEYRTHAVEKAGSFEKAKELEKFARNMLKSELGHGPDRDDVVSQYIGSPLGK
jgi:site-specific recombinase XerD